MDSTVAKTYTGTSWTNQKVSGVLLVVALNGGGQVVLQRIPQYTAVTMSGSGTGALAAVVVRRQ